MNASLAQQNKNKNKVDVESVPLFLKNIITIDKWPITKVINMNEKLDRKNEHDIKGEKWGRKKKLKMSGDESE